MESSVSNAGPNCSICQDIYRHPKVVSCGHSFCVECLQEWAPRDTFNTSCPVCNKQIGIPNGNVDDLPTNFGLQDAIEIIRADGRSPLKTIQLCQQPEQAGESVIILTKLIKVNSILIVLV